MEVLQRSSVARVLRRWGVLRYLLVAIFSLLFFASRSEALQLPSLQSTTSTCATSSPSSGAYSVTICFSAPAASSTLTGASTVTAAISVSGTSPGVKRVVFSLDGAYALTDYQGPYTFLLPSDQWVDGSHSLGASAVMQDGFTTKQVVEPVIFSNGVTSPPVNTNQFQPTSGTVPSIGSPFVVVATGDGASGETTAGGVSNLILSLNPNLFLYLGDVYEKGSVSEFFNWYGTASTFFGRLRSITDPTIGNHEYTSNKAPGYFNYWDNIPNYYSFNAGGWHFVSLNSNTYVVSASAGSAQYNWLQQDLASVPAQMCTIVYYHHPLFNIGPEGPTTAMSDVWALMAQYGVDIVLNGHDHDYQRWKPLDGTGNPASDGITEFVAGAGGHSMQHPSTTNSRVAYSNSTSPTAFGALLLQLNSNGASFSYHSSSGTILDSGVVPCVQAGGDSVPPTTPGNLTGAASSAGQVDLSWTASTDNVGVEGYTVYRNGLAITTIAPDQLSYSDTAVSPSSAYTYAVDAFDAAGNHSPATAPISVLTPDANGNYTYGDVADTYVNATYPNTNYGGATSMRADVSPDRHAYLRFTVSGLGGQSIASAKLLVWANSSSSVGIKAVGVGDNSWGEKKVTYNTAPALGSVLSSSGGFASGNWVTLDVSSYITAEGTYSVALTTPGTTSLSFSTKEATANRPQLIIRTGTPSQSTPTPTAAFTSTPTLTPTVTPTSTPPPPTSTPTPTATVSAGGSVTFLPDADAYVNSSSPSTNYGSATVLRADLSPDLHSYARFTVSGLGGLSIASVHLLFYMNSSSSAGMQALAVSDNTWGEKTITYSNAPTLGSTIATSGALSTGTWVSLDVTPYVTGEGTYSFGIITPGSTAISFASRESGTNAPQLVINLGP